MALRITIPMHPRLADRILCAALESSCYKQWVCCMFDENGELVQSLGGVDFGRDVEPWGPPYRRVVEAELALEEMP
jgi:hypothetical protein